MVVYWVALGFNQYSGIMLTLKQSNFTVAAPSFLNGGGEMGELTRQFDWASTSIGPPTQWPQSLRTTVSNLLRSKFPMFLWWGQDMIQFYNDAYRPSMGMDGKHPFALGAKGADTWPEIWDVISPLHKQVQKTGEATWMEDQLIPIYRNGKLEDVYWTYSYSSVLGDDGEHAGILVTCTETTKQVTAISRLTSSEQRFQNLVRDATAAIVVLTGPEMKVEIVNQAYGLLIDRTIDELLGKPLFTVIPEAAAHYLPLLEKVYQTGEPMYLYDSPYAVVSNGKNIEGFLHVVYQPYRGADGVILGVMAIIQDITTQVLARQEIEQIVALRTQELAQANQSLQDMNKELSRSNYQLEEFAHAASHDLKEPIRKIQFFTIRLMGQLEGKIPAEQCATLARINKASERMGMLIDDLLIYSHVSHLPHEKENVDLNEKIKRVLEDLELDIQDKGACFDVANLPVVRGYSRQLQQLFQNLISNAIKYSKAGVVPQISISSNRVKEGVQAYYVIEVSDNGIGFEPEYSDKIFKMFTRLHGKSEYSGTGIGLSIVKKIVENHNGIIRVQSEPGMGAAFCIYLPL